MIFDKDPGKNVGKFLRYGIKILLSVEISFAAIQLDCKCPVIANNVFLNQDAVEIFQDFTLVISDSYASLKAKSLIAVECTRINYWDVETKNSKIRIYELPIHVLVSAFSTKLLVPLPASLL